MIRHIKIFLLFLLLSGLSFAQVVDRIEIRGNRYVPDDLIKEILLTKEGSQFSIEKVRRDIKRLFKTGFFKRIEVHKFEENGKVKLLYIQDRVRGERGARR